ncbi:low molecular weight protein-tyrosine-phosphatase [Mobiluncus mulieris]|uniref:low molecular weight protein-tyrosine-phosphatase n=1 Tax=Mobiluncus mulieris TaxID=2052 RepID=UPI000E04FC56|nr:low molecular weight protein-tyrosine-phosphatase [Mobiluncus mulieris]STY84253.1 Probable low molecular weight protein-tyrosine-phosphatase [Mobiluncus mulieris]
MQILVVCTGNICRSPMGEIVLREYLQREGLSAPKARHNTEPGIPEGGLGTPVVKPSTPETGLSVPEVTVASAGTSDEEHGHGLDRRAAQVLREAGYPLPREHFAHRATAAELRKSGLILAMTVGHARLLREMLEAAGEDTRKLHLWREFDGTIPFAPGGVFGEGGVLQAPHEPGKNPTQRPKRKHYSDQYSSDGDYDVPDPWYGGLDGFYDTLTVVEAGATGIVKYLRRR